MAYCKEEEAASKGVCLGGGNVNKGQMEGSGSCMKMGNTEEEGRTREGGK